MGRSLSLGGRGGGEKDSSVGDVAGKSRTLELEDWRGGEGGREAGIRWVCRRRDSNWARAASRTGMRPRCFVDGRRDGTRNSAGSHPRWGGRCSQWGDAT